MSRKQYVLYDAQKDFYVGLYRGTAIAVERIESAVIFDERDNMTMKKRFYDNLLGLDLTIREYIA